MVRSHGWSGNTPTSDDEAIDRILNAADDIIAERGTSMRIADVARTLGVTRQTVYRYFASTEELLLGTAMRSGDGFLEQLAARVCGITDPVAALVEGVAFAIERIGDDEQIRAMLTTRSLGGISASITSDTAMAFGRSMLHRFEVDWEANGFDTDALDELAEFCLRVLHSFVIDGGHAPRAPAELRDYLRRWLGPSIVYPRFADAMDSLTKCTVPRRPRQPRRRTAS